MILDDLQNFKSVGHVDRILQTSPYFTQITHFLDNRWSDWLEILHAALDYHYLSLVQISSRYHFPNLRYKILGLIWAKKGILGWSVKYTQMAGGKNWPHAPKIYLIRSLQAKFEQKILARKKRGVLLSAFSKSDDVITGQWRHLWWQNFLWRCQFIFCAHLQISFRNSNPIKNYGKKNIKMREGLTCFVSKIKHVEWILYR